MVSPKELNFEKIKFNGYAFQIEIKWKIYKNKLKIYEHPIVFYERQEGQSKMSKGIILEAIINVIRMKLKKLS